MRRIQGRTTPSAAVLFALVLLLSGCEDAVTEPDAMLGASEAEALLSSASELTMLPTVAERARERLAHGTGDPRAESALGEAEALWVRAAESGPVAARRMRAAAARLAAPHLAQVLPPREWAEVRTAQYAWIEMASGMFAHLDSPAIAASLRTGTRLLGEAETAAREGYTEAAARSTLLAGARLVETTPRWVAARLTESAEQALESWGVDEGIRQDDRTRRVERLVDGARTAFEQGEYLLSARRARYAQQLMEGR